jgi:ankyrin repeat protein
MDNFNELLKNAIIKNDIHFLETNKSKYDINYCFSDEDNDTLLLYAISDSGSESYIYFLKNGADIKMTNNEGENIFHSIVYSGDSKRLLSLLEIHPEAIKQMNKPANDGTTPLLLSVLLNKYNIFKQLLDLGANVDLVDNMGNAPIHPACSMGYTNIVKELVNKGVNLRIKTVKGNYPMALAVNGDHYEIVKFLYSKIYT